MFKCASHQKEEANFPLSYFSNYIWLTYVCWLKSELGMGECQQNHFPAEFFTEENKKDLVHSSSPVFCLKKSCLLLEYLCIQLSVVTMSYLDSSARSAVLLGNCNDVEICLCSHECTMRLWMNMCERNVLSSDFFFLFYKYYVILLPHVHSHRVMFTMCYFFFFFFIDVLS